MFTLSNYFSVWFGDVYSDLANSVGKSVKEYLDSLGYCGSPVIPNFRVPLLGDTYLTPDGKIATKERGDKGPYGPRLIVVREKPRKKRVLVFDFDEVANATGVLCKHARPGAHQWLLIGCLHADAMVEIEGVVEEREA